MHIRLWTPGVGEPEEAEMVPLLAVQNNTRSAQRYYSHFASRTIQYTSGVAAAVASSVAAAATRCIQQITSTNADSVTTTKLAECKSQIRRAKVAIAAIINKMRENGIQNPATTTNGKAMENLSEIADVQRRAAKAFDTLSGDDIKYFDGEPDYLHPLLAAIEAVEIKRVRIAVVAAIKAGKSLVVANFVGAKLSPSDSSACTTLPVLFRHDRHAVGSRLDICEALYESVTSAHSAIREFMKASGGDGQNIRRDLLNGADGLSDYARRVMNSSESVAITKTAVDDEIPRVLNSINKTARLCHRIPSLAISLITYAAQPEHYPVVTTAMSVFQGHDLPFDIEILDMPGIDEAEFAGEMGSIMDVGIKSSNQSILVIDAQTIEATHNIAALEPLIEAIASSGMWVVVSKMDVVPTLSRDAVRDIVTRQVNRVTPLSRDNVIPVSLTRGWLMQRLRSSRRRQLEQGADDANTSPGIANSEESADLQAARRILFGEGCPVESQVDELAARVLDESNVHELKSRILHDTQEHHLPSVVTGIVKATVVAFGGMLVKIDRFKNIIETKKEAADALYRQGTDCINTSCDCEFPHQAPNILGASASLRKIAIEDEAAADKVSRDLYRILRQHICPEEHTFASQEAAEKAARSVAGDARDRVQAEIHEKITGPHNRKLTELNLEGLVSKTVAAIVSTIEKDIGPPSSQVRVALQELSDSRDVFKVIPIDIHSCGGERETHFGDILRRYRWPTSKVLPGEGFFAMIIGFLAGRGISAFKEEEIITAIQGVAAQMVANEIERCAEEIKARLEGLEAFQRKLESEVRKTFDDVREKYDRISKCRDEVSRCLEEMRRIQDHLATDAQTIAAKMTAATNNRGSVVGDDVFE